MLRDAILASRPVFFWECLEAPASGKTLDSTGRQGPGPFIAGTACFQGRSAQALRRGSAWAFDQTGAAKAASSSINPTIAAPFAIEAVIMPSPGSGDRVIVGNGSGTGSTIPGWQLRLRTGDVMRFILIKDGSNFFAVDTNSAALQIASAHELQLAHIFAVYDASSAAPSALSIWVNGRKQSVTGLTGGTVTTIATSEVIQVAGGYSSQAGLAAYVKNVAYYDRAPGAMEIIEHYKQTVAERVRPRPRTLAISTSAIKTVMGLARASVKTVDGLALANVKTIEGLA